MHRKVIPFLRIMNQGTTVVVALIAAASLSAMVYAIQEQ
jgi:hypothetical protein